MNEDVVVVTRKPAPEGRRLGSAKGDFIVPVGFDDPLPEEVLAEFENKARTVASPRTGTEAPTGRCAESPNSTD